MDADALRALMDDVASGGVEPDDAVRLLQRLPFADIGIARVDHHRALRQGLPEAVYGPGKTAEEVALVVAELLTGGSGPVVLSRAEKVQVEAALAVETAATVEDLAGTIHAHPTMGESIMEAALGLAGRPVHRA